MPRYSRDEIRPGLRMEGGTYPADDPRRARITKGKFMTVDAQPTLPTRNYTLAKQADAIALLVARLQAVRENLQKVRGK